MPSFTTRNGLRLAYNLTPGRGPGVVFLGGFKSDMEGTKALDLEAWCKAEGRAYLRLDYAGHGQSEGTFEEGTIGDWFRDAAHVIGEVTTGPQIIVGSSMGGWIALLYARAFPDRVAGLVTLAAAPDFTEDGYWAGFTEAEQQEVMEQGRIAIPSEYGEPYIITRKLIEAGRETLVLRTPLHLPFPTRFILGTADTAVPLEWGTRLLNHATGPDMRLTLIKDADHRLSNPDELALIRASVTEVLERATQAG